MHIKHSLSDFGRSLSDFWTKRKLELLFVLVFLAPLMWFFLVNLVASPDMLAATVKTPPNGFAYVTWAVTSVLLLVASFVVLKGARTKFAEAQESVDQRYKKLVEDIEQDVVRYIETSIVFKQSPDELRKFLLPKLNAFKEASKEREEIVILGADQLRPSWDQYNKMKEKAAGRWFDSPEEHREFLYGQEFKEILDKSSNKHLTRYISLFRPQDLRGRTSDFREGYVQWLQDQVTYFNINENYTIVNTPRATVWGAPKSIIFFQNNMVEVIFRQGGVVLTSRSDNTDETFVSTTRKWLINRYVNETPPAQKKFSQSNLFEFEEYLAQIKAEVQGGPRTVGVAVSFTESSHRLRLMLGPVLQEFLHSSDEKIVILGADRLRPNIKQLAELEKKNSGAKFGGTDEEKINWEYGRLFNRILDSSSQKKFTRFIYLFPPDDLMRRTKDLRDGYLAWLNDQRAFMQQTEAYTIIDTPRATVWGAPKSIIFCRNTLAEIFFRGGGIIVTDDPEQADAVVAPTKKLLIDDYVGSPEGPKSKKFNKEDIDSFDEYIRKVSDAVSRADLQDKDANQ
jgi:hypothetical protein